VAADKIDTIVSLSKRRGFVFPCSEIYGGQRAAWDYGPLGVELKENIKRQWWKAMVQQRDDMVGLDSSVILPRQVWEASGHVDTFNDPLTECQSCHKRFRADHLQEEIAEKKAKSDGQSVNPDDVDLKTVPCPNCGTRGAWTEPRQFSGLLKTYLGVVEDESGLHYLRPETAQGIFINFANVVTSSRMKPPFGIAQIGKSFRNEITPGNFIFRDREFEQMEMEFFVHPSEEERWFAYWVAERLRWCTDEMGIAADRLRLRPHDPDELSHYSRQTTDVEYAFPMGWSELEGVADRTDYDLRAHAAGSGKALAIFDEASGEHVTPFVIEPAMGVDRAVLTVLLDGYTEEQLEKERRTVLRIRPSLAPIKVAVLPLLRNRPELVERARALTADLKASLAATYDDTASIGKLYRRQDEIGTPFCVTVDVDSLDDGAATIRERDSMTQERVGIAAIPDRLAGLIAGTTAWEGVPRQAAATDDERDSG
jgi:glycyl-tRNA synthetase